ncbi:ABC transporter [Strigomonas culicis]|uniref:ABC transporter n=1 Tax=Strigomonas culicis TaxID=28005 RepID=S9USV1_9TRYP|nr:ABC transporter [Strigomonas culicis]|eukprot:EPY31978.1 ABC transporter [Strigomonas culicis]
MSNEAKEKRVRVDDPKGHEDRDPNAAAHPELPQEPSMYANTSVVARGFDVQGSVADFNAGSLNTGSISSSFALPLSWYKLNYSAGKRRILCGLTGTALPSRCLAILGSSGAGKTTFLNAVCDRLAENSNLKLSGRRQLGDTPYERSHRRALGFVTQDDIVSALSTPADALWFSVRTRRGLSPAEARQRVEETLETLRLVHCRDTQVGIPGLVAGLSGGERKRCNIGIELICDPKVLLLDEPTSGLDSVTSAKVVHLLRTLSREGRTVIYTIHQPTAEVMSNFDDLMLMTQGRVAYHGTSSNALDYFESIGFRCPDKYTPTDYFMTLLQDYVTSKVLIKRWRVYLKKGGQRTPHTAAVRLAPSKDESVAAKYLEGYIRKFGSSSLVQFTELTKRCMVEMLRSRLYISAPASQSLLFAITMGLIFLNIRDNVAGIQDREGLLFSTVMNRSMGPCFIMVNAFFNVRAVYTREQAAACYSPLTYFLSRSIAELPMQLFFILLECIILYFMVGLHVAPASFFYYFAVIALVSQIATGLGFMLSALLPSLMVASAMAPLVLMPLAAAGGLFASTTRLRPYWYFLEKLSFMRHGYILVLRNELNNVDRIYCNNNENGDSYCVTQAKNGKQVLASLGFDDDPQSTTTWMWVSLVILFLLFRFFCVVGLTRSAHKKV